MALRAGPVLRFSRALVVTSVAGGLGAGAHVLAGGLLPSRGVLLAGLSCLYVVTAAFLSGPASPRRLVALVGAGQFVSHVFLTATAGHTGQPGGAATAARAALDARLAAVAAGEETRSGSFYDLTMAPTTAHGTGGASGPRWAANIVEDLTGPHALMALAHLAAAVGAALWLAAGEQALWLLICLLGTLVIVAATALLARAGATPPLHSLLPAARRRRALRPPLPPPLLGALARRGPPVATLG